MGGKSRKAEPKNVTPSKAGYLRQHGKEIASLKIAAESSLYWSITLPLDCGAEVSTCMHAWFLFFYNSKSVNEVVHRTKLLKLLGWDFTATNMFIDCN